MFKHHILVGICLLLTACGATSEVALMEDLPVTLASVKPVVSSSPEAKSMPPANSASPVASVNPMPSNTPMPSAMPSAVTEAIPTFIKQGLFKNSFHTVTGKAFLLQSEGKHYARLEDFYTDNGPDLYVYLVRNNTGKPQSTSDFVSLGRLKATKGNQNYEIPAGTDLSQIQSITIWCQAFSVNFGYAPVM